MASGRIFIASDHNGMAAKAYITKMLGHMHLVVDLGPQDGDGKVDYVDYARIVCKNVVLSGGKGILICGTGTGMCIAANRFAGIRAAIVTDRVTAALSREHNDANVLVLGQWRTALGQMDEIVGTWLATEYLGGRHTPRLAKLAALGGASVSDA